MLHPTLLNFKPLKIQTSLTQLRKLRSSNASKQENLTLRVENKAPVSSRKNLPCFNLLQRNKTYQEETLNHNPQWEKGRLRESMREGAETTRSTRIAWKGRVLPLKLRIDRVSRLMTKIWSPLLPSLQYQVLMISQRSVGDTIRSHFPSAGTVMGPDGTANITCPAKTAMKSRHWKSFAHLEQPHRMQSSSKTSILLSSNRAELMVQV